MDFCPELTISRPPLLPLQVSLATANVGIRNLYYQLWDVEATIGLGLADVAVGFPMLKGGGILLTLRSIDDQLPPLNYPWEYPGANIQILILDPYGNVYNSNATQRTVLP